jgi:imidazolonepropionase
MKTSFINIKELIQVREKGSSPYIKGKEMQELPLIRDAFMEIEGDTITGYGTMDTWREDGRQEVVDCSGKTILPTWIDSHTHIVYAGNREGEFADKIKGLSYEEIARRGGGIINSVMRLRDTHEDIIYNESARRLEKIMHMGTGAIEIKSGYGLNKEAELKMLRVIRRLKENYPLSIKATFLGAHAIPPEYQGNNDAYVDYMLDEILPEASRQGLVDFVDVFCEKGYFSVKQTRKILQEASRLGLEGKIHVNQFNSIGGVQASLENSARSIDHLEVLSREDLDALRKSSGTMPVALPGCSFFLGIPYTPARTIIDAGLPLALASDYNPGSSPSGNMNFILSLASIKMKMTPEEGINAATLNAAYALNLHDSLGSITPGKKASFIITEPIPSYTFLSYAYGENLIDSVYLNGKKII